ncbi:SIS domain-containing protein [Fluviispira multicolorata]|uniref:SIS domain-containing protein n=1 Tax=Fluviispira multicolorata TaxID=2654512 RepID=A0A833JG33_9BACT|nr:SIS domain-containing protein [Fluviispira multicolorata]KAB8031931.1 SIS domain-containing protein [Fluviispira multicolorata]
MHNVIIENAMKRAEHISSAIHWYAQSLNENETYNKNFMQLVNELVQCATVEKANKQVFFIAVGKSALVAQLAVSMLVSVGVLARFVHPTEALHGDLGVVGKKDTVVLISNNGRSAELLQLLPGLDDRNVSTYALTSKEDSPLAKLTQYLLPIPSVEEFCPLSQAPITSTVTSLALCQLLVAATVEMRNYPIDDYARNHPGGAIGKRIFLKADSLMIQGDELPIVTENDSFQAVISTFTKFSKAAVLVLEKGKFLGLISEKDLRKAMENFGPKVFELTANDIMNKNPTSVRPGLLALEVFQLMNSKNPPFNLLPVIDSDGNGIGIVRFLDFVSAGVTL